MNRNAILAALAIAAASSAFAESPTVETTPFASARSRAEVTAEFLRARAESAALTAEDSGSSYLNAKARSAAAPVVAGQPANAQ